MKTMNEWLNAGRYQKYAGSYFFNKRIVCSDGFSISIQANDGAYCRPREDIDDVSVYSMFELGFPSDECDVIREYAEGENSLTDTVYPYVPRDVVEKMIESHGGITGFYKKDSE